MARAKPTPLLHTERLLSLVPFISANQGVSLKELATTFNVSTAQMNSDLTTLWMCGLPGYTALELMDLSFDSGYVTIRNAETLQAPRSLNLDEIVALLMGLDLLKNSIAQDSPLHENIDILVERLSQKSGISSKLRATSGVSSVLRAQIQTAMNSQNSLQIRYHSLYSDLVSDRLVSPIELRVENGIEYLFAFCHQAQSFRVFRLDRVLQCTPQKNVQITQSHESAKQNHVISFSVKLRSRLRLMNERFSLPSISDSDMQRSESYSEQWIIRSIFGSSGSIELTEPPFLRSEIAQKAQLILDRYLAT